MRPFFRIAIVLIATLALLPLVGLRTAEAQRISLVRDAEIEGLLKDYTAPIFGAAGLGRGAVDVHLVNNPSFNAFVTGRNMFFHTGALMQAETPNEIIGVIAHETGHIIGGHQQRMRDRMERLSVLAAVGMLMGAGAMVTGGDLGDAAGQALIQGGGSVLRRQALAYQREEESAADRAALTLLEKTGQSGRGMIESFERLASNSLFSSSRADPYATSHPLPRDRIALLQTKARESRYFETRDPAALQLRHDMMRAKIAAYTGGLGAVQRLFKEDLNSAPARYGFAITQHLSGRTANALKAFDQLLKEQPNNAYLHEMKAEALLQAGRAADAVKPMQQAIRLDPYDSGLLKIQYGHVLMETGNQANVSEAIRQLKAGLARDPKTVSGYTYLARAYSLAGEQGLALAATAEARFLVGNFKEAKQFARRAQASLNRNSAEWLSMDDIIKYNPPKRR